MNKTPNKTPGGNKTPNVPSKKTPNVQSKTPTAKVQTPKQMKQTPKNTPSSQPEKQQKKKLINGKQPAAFKTPQPQVCGPKTIKSVIMK